MSFIDGICGSLSLSHGEVNYNRSPVNGKYQAHTEASFSCNYGYTRSGSASRTCQTSGNWNGEMSTCSLSIKANIKNELC